jgi:hypothetical protein
MTPEQIVARATQAEHFEMAEVDYFAGLLALAGRCVQVRYSPDQAAALASMRCWDGECRFSYTVEARLRPDGAIGAHGGNWLESAATLHEVVDLFASSAPYAQGA